MVTLRSASWASSCMTNFSTTRPTISGVRPAKGITASSRLRNSGVNMRLIASSSSPSRHVAAEADGLLGHVGGAGIGGHDQDDVAEIDRLAVVVGQLAVVHHLQQDVEQVGMRLLDLIEQQHAMRVLVDRVGQQAALVEADIARRRADQPRDACAAPCIPTCRSGSARCPAWRPAGAPPRSCRRRSGRRTGSCRSASPARAGRRALSLIAADSASIAASWPNTMDLQVALQVAQRLLVVGGDATSAGCGRSWRRSPRRRAA